MIFDLLSLPGLDIDAIEEPTQQSGDHAEGAQPTSTNAELDSILSSNLGHMVPDGKWTYFFNLPMDRKLRIYTYPYSKCFWLGIKTSRKGIKITVHTSGKKGGSLVRV